MLGDTILKGLTRFEPRVKVENINITTDFDNQQYTIDLLLSVPSLNITGLQVKGTLAESGFYFN
jgi:phage baseplate assembly protein W